MALILPQTFGARGTETWMGGVPAAPQVGWRYNPTDETGSTVGAARCGEPDSLPHRHVPRLLQQFGAGASVLPPAAEGLPGLRQLRLSAEQLRQHDPGSCCWKEQHACTMYAAMWRRWLDGVCNERQPMPLRQQRLEHRDQGPPWVH
jgi:hypothetical protein